VLRKAIKDGAVARGSRVVCVLTGNGLKDLPAVSDGLPPPQSVTGTPASIAAAIGL